MAIYYQHIGRELWRRDAPRSIGTPRGGLVKFALADLKGAFSELQADERVEISAKLSVSSFQIWGLPSGAAGILRNVVDGDHLLLLESEDFRYVGKILHFVREPLWNLSDQIWGEQKFPLIVLLDGTLIEYPWSSFHREFDFASKYHMRGNTMQLADRRIASSKYRSEEEFIRQLTRERRVE